FGSGTWCGADSAGTHPLRNAPRPSEPGSGAQTPRTSRTASRSPIASTPPPRETTHRPVRRRAGAWRERRRTRIGTLPRPTGWTNGCRRLPVPPVGSVPNGMAIHEEPDTVGGNVDVADLWFGNAFVGLDQQLPRQVHGCHRLPRISG